MRRNVLILALCQALAMTGAAMLIAVSALAGQVLAPDKSLATLPFAVQFLASMMATIPASLLMAKIGRRVGFTLGQGFGACGGGLSAYAIYLGSFELLVLGGFLIGVHNAFWQYYRFAAADAATVEFRPRAISYVMAGGVIAAFAGPQLAKWTADLSAATFAASYASFILLGLIAATLLQFTRLPSPEAGARYRSGRPITEIMRSPVFIIAAMSSLIGYGVMNMLMTSTPLAMAFCGFAFSDSATVIQWHAVGMFLPSFFTGHIIKRFGVVNVIGAGIVMQAISIGVAMSGIEFINFWAGLVFLGLGWNFMFIGGTSLLTEVYTPEERAKTQAAHDFLVFSMVALTAFASGALHETLGWAAVNLIAAVPVSVAFIAVVWFRLRNSAPGTGPSAA